MIKKMSKIRIIGPKTLLDDTIKTLHELSVLHIEPVSLKDYDKDVTHIPVEESKFEKKSILEDALEKATNLLFMLPSAGFPDPLDPAINLEDAVFEVSMGDEDIKRLFLEKEDLEEEIRHLNDYEKLLTGFAPIASELGGLRNYEIMGLTVDTKRRNILHLLEKEIEKITHGKHEIHTSPISENTTGMVLAVISKEAPAVRKLFFGEGIQELILPKEYEEKPIVDAIQQMAKRVKEASLRLLKINDELKALANHWRPKLEWIKREASSELEEIGALRHFAQTRYCFIIEGWVPIDRYEVIKQRLKEKFSDKILVKPLPVDDSEKIKAPVFIHNPGWIKPFEVFLKALPTPRYGSVDPTPFIAFFFPAFFGIIVGDMGYGVIISFLSFLIRFKVKKNPFFRDLMSVFISCGISAIFFGFLFGEFFGNLGEELHITHPVWIDRIKAVKSFLVISLGIGVGHVLFGILIGIYSKIRQRHIKEAALKSLFFVLVVSFIALLLALFKLIPHSVINPVFLAFIGTFLVLLIFEGILGAVEFIEAVGNILSYVRIMAIGTSSVILAMVANRVGEAMGNVVIGITVAALIHIMNIIISMMSPTIQSMRLQYVEFLGKFYEEGGRPYTPFKK